MDERHPSIIPAMLKLYAYSGCSTCKNALKWLKAHAITFEEIAIRETPPSLAELKAMLLEELFGFSPSHTTSKKA